MPLNKKYITNKIKEITRIKKSLIFFDIIELILISSIVILFYVTSTMTTTKVFFIPKGSTNNTIKYLNKSGFEMNVIDKTIVRFLGYPQSGWIDFKTQYLTKADFLYRLTKSKAALNNITLIPGETSYIFLRQLSKKLNLSLEKLETTYNRHAYKLDGNILAETYSIPIGMKEEHLIFYLFSYTNNKYKKFSNKIFGEYNKKKWYKYISMASVIQKEAASIKEMPIVSSVIHNRIKKKMALQMDGTLNYGKYSHIKITAKRIKEDISSYNSYKNRGIPANPICAVSLSAIKAAIFPDKTSYLYFVKDERTGLHNFTSNYNDHVRKINKNRVIKRKIKKEKIEVKKKVKTKEKKNLKSLWKTVP